MEAYDRLCVQSHSIRPPERIAGTPICRLSHMERPAKDRRRTGLKTSRHRASGDAAGRRFPTDPDSRPMPTGDWHGIQNGFSKQGPGKSRLPMVSNPFPDRTFTRSTASILSGRSRRALPARSRSLLRILKVCRGPNGRLRPFEKQRRTMRQTSRKQHVTLHRERVALGRPVLRPVCAYQRRDLMQRPERVAARQYDVQQRGFAFPGRLREIQLVGRPIRISDASLRSTVPDSPRRNHPSSASGARLRPGSAGRRSGSRRPPSRTADPATRYRPRAICRADA